MNYPKANEFEKLIEDLLENKEFQKTKLKKHHGLTRYDHSMRVAAYTYKVTKLLKLNYKEATCAALYHDFFLDEVEEENGLNRLRKHPEKALINTKKYFKLTPLQEDVIIKHMFPVTLTPPKYKESWIVDIVDDYASVIERINWLKILISNKFKKMQLTQSYIIVLLLKIINIK